MQSSPHTRICAFYNNGKPFIQINRTVYSNISKVTKFSQHLTHILSQKHGPGPDPDYFKGVVRKKKFGMRFIFFSCLSLIWFIIFWNFSKFTWGLQRALLPPPPLPPPPWIRPCSRTYTYIRILVCGNGDELCFWKGVGL